MHTVDKWTFYLNHFDLLISCSFSVCLQRIWGKEWDLHSKTTRFSLSRAHGLFSVWAGWTASGVYWILANSIGFRSGGICFESGLLIKFGFRVHKFIVWSSACEFHTLPQCCFVRVPVVASELFSPSSDPRRSIWDPQLCKTIKRHLYDNISLCSILKSGISRLSRHLFSWRRIRFVSDQHCTRITFILSNLTLSLYVFEIFIWILAVGFWSFSLSIELSVRILLMPYSTIVCSKLPQIDIYLALSRWQSQPGIPRA